MECSVDPPHRVKKIYHWMNELKINKSNTTKSVSFKPHCIKLFFKMTLWLSEKIIKYSYFIFLLINIYIYIDTYISIHIHRCRTNPSVCYIYLHRQNRRARYDRARWLQTPVPGYVTSRYSHSFQSHDELQGIDKIILRDIFFPRQRGFNR